MNRIIVIVVVVLCVWLMWLYPHTMLNPGELVKGHQDIQYKCKSCHEPFWGISTEKCKSCHKPSEIDKDTNGKMTKIPFHNLLKEKECISCHKDHKGIIPTVPISVFDHRFLSAADQQKCNICHVKPQDNLHKNLSETCSNCHNTKGWKSSGKFDHKMIQGLEKTNCELCHIKPVDFFHASLKENCSKCHSPEKWKPATFDHSSYFRLDKDHSTTCNICHTNNAKFSIYTCYGCHEHSESNIRAEHNEEGIYLYTDCMSCHRGGNKHEGNPSKVKQGKESREEDDD